MGSDGMRDCFAGRALAEFRVDGNPVADVFMGNIPSRDEIRSDSAKCLRLRFGMSGRAAWDETAVLIALRGARWSSLRASRWSPAPSR